MNAAFFFFFFFFVFLRGVKGMKKSRTKLRLQIQALKLVLKQRVMQMKDLKAKKIDLDRQVKLVSKEEQNTRRHMYAAAKRYHRATVLGQADDVMARKIRNKIDF